MRGDFHSNPIDAAFPPGPDKSCIARRKSRHLRHLVRRDQEVQEGEATDFSLNLSESS